MAKSKKTAPKKTAPKKTAPKKAAPKKAAPKKAAPKKSTKKVTTTNVENKEPVKRTKPDKESVLKLIDELSESINTEISERRESNSKVKGIRYLRSLNKQLKKIRSHSNRVMKTKNKKPRTVNQNSGFLKAVQISKDLSTFTGFEGLVSRVDVTKYICKYIKDNNLQNPEDRRQIVPDKKLSSLLNYDSKTAEQPLTYFRIQSLMKDHFVKTE